MDNSRYQPPQQGIFAYLVVYQGLFLWRSAHWCVVTFTEIQAETTPLPPPPLNTHTKKKNRKESKNKCSVFQSSTGQIEPDLMTPH